MAILMQGAWTIQVIQKEAAREQRFVISGGSNNGPFPGVVGSPPVTVSGFDWNLTVQSKIGSTWVNSTEKIQFPASAVSGFNILSDDAGVTPDLDFNDLVLHVSPVATSGATDYFVYGNVSCYKGFCRLFNPCFPRYIVIDSQIALNEALLHPGLREYIQKIYPDKVFEKPVKLPVPIPDPPPFTPLMLPLQNDLLLPNKEATLFKRQITEQPGIKKSAKEESAAVETFTAVSSVRLANAVTTEAATSSINKVALAGLRDKIHLHCDVDAMPFAILRVLEYDRTDAEKAGGPYTGTGNRQVLGYAITDNFGNYVFRFQRTDFDDLAEVDADMVSGENIFVQAKPDLIIQLLDPEDTGSVLHETALYANVGTFKKINICFPCVSGPKACNGQGIIQYIGDLLLIQGVSGTRGGDGNILGSTGKISNVGSNLLCAAWQGRLKLIACLKNDTIKFYTVKYKLPPEPASQWKIVTEGCTLPKFNGIDPLPVATSIRRSRTINGVPNTECYENVENSIDANQWITTSNLKAFLTTFIYVNDKLFTDQQGTVQFRIEGYQGDAAGTKIATVDETIDLYLDNRGVEADIDPNIQLGGTTLGNCALFTLPFTVIDGVKVVTDEKTPITIRFRAKQASGFMGQYALSIAKGAIGNITLTRTSPAPAVFHTTALPTAAGQTHVGRFYSDTGNLISCFFNGTPIEPGFPGDYIELTLRPENNWLDADQNFCAFRVRVDGYIRHTDGENSNPNYSTSEVLIGIERPE
jgi:hypothetical protein